MCALFPFGLPWGTIVLKVLLETYLRSETGSPQVTNKHPYRRATFAFNGKLERAQRIAILTPIEWLRVYERENERDITKIFNSNGDPMFDDLELFDTYVEKLPIGMKNKSIFYEIPYWEHLKISHLLDPMHIFKNVSYSLWRHISSK